MSGRPVALGARRPLERDHGPRWRPLVALTFDDGPGPLTPAVLDVLAEEGATGTFFVRGSQVKGQEEVLCRALDEGHLLGNHSWSHLDLAQVPGPEAAEELRRTTEAIRHATGLHTCLFRPPFGSSTRELVDIAAAQGLMTIGWDVSTRDWAGSGSDREQISERAVRGVRRGSILLMHDGGEERTALLAALPGIVRGLRARGLSPVTLDGLLSLPIDRK